MALGDVVDDDDDEFFVVQDASGRVHGATTRVADEETLFRAEALAKFLDVDDALAEKCRAIEREGSRWLSSVDAPRCGVERAARAVFERYAKGWEYDAETSGVEFWTQTERVGTHFDKDEEARERYGVWLTPHVATVTYVEGDGGSAPTVVFDGLTPRSQPDAENHDGSACERTVVMFPSRGAHFKFDGRFLHGVYEELSRDGDEGRRTTLLANVWFNHKPVGIERLPDSFTDDYEPQIVESPESLTPSVLCPACLDVSPMKKCTFGPTGTEYALVGATDLPTVALRACADAGMSLIFLEHRDGDDIRIEVPKDEPDAKRTKAT